MAHIGIGKRRSHYLWIVLGAVALLTIAYVWTNVY
jgi:hypothetical protein